MSEDVDNSSMPHGGAKAPRVQLQLHLHRQPRSAAETVEETYSLEDYDDATVESELVPEAIESESEQPFSKEMECISCGLLADVDMDVETCTCPDCGETMYPSESIDLEATDNDLEIEVQDDEQSDNNLGQRFRSIKVAHPVNVGMFSSTNSGSISVSASSKKLGKIDFLSSTSSTPSIVLESQSSSDPAVLELEMALKNVEEERADLSHQREQLTRAINDFNEKRKAFEKFRLEWELQRQNLEGHSPPDSSGDLNMAATIVASDPLHFDENSKKKKMLTLAVIAMGVLLLLQTLGLVMLALRR